MSMLAIAEPHATALLLAAFGVLMAVSVIFSRPVDRLGVPVVLLFLLLGMLGGSEGIGGVYFDDYELTVRVGTIALVLILFDGGLNTSVAGSSGSTGPPRCCSAPSSAPPTPPPSSPSFGAVACS
jgi:potassium/hydrogen antiporter